MSSKTNTVPSRWIALALCVLSSFALPGDAKSSPRIVHVFVALADNQHQGIIPVPPALGNGKDPQRNLYWGAAYGVKTYFRASQDWELVWSGRGAKDAILERCVFKSRQNDVYLVADAYEGSQIKLAVTDFLSAAAGVGKEKVSVKSRAERVSVAIAGDADLVVYVGHDALMDFQIPPIAGTKGEKPGRRSSSRAPANPFSRLTFGKPALHLCYGQPASWLRRPTR